MKKVQILSLMIFFSFSLLSFNWKSADESMKVDVSKSNVKWTGYHLAKSYEHYGNVKFKSGTLEMSGDDIVGGNLVIDMTSITNTDLTKEKDNKKLVNHLKSEDFFFVEKHPEAVLKINSATRNGDAYNIKADITIRGISEPIEFEAKRTSQSANSATFEAKLSIDRTKHKVSYGWTLENAILSNTFDMDVKLVVTT